MSLVLGVDIGGTNTVFGLVDRKGIILYRGQLSTAQYPDPHGLVNALYEKTRPVLTDGSLLKRDDPGLIGIGVGAPNGNVYTGNIEFAVNLPWKGSFPLAEYFNIVFGLPSVLTNDANAAAMGELIYGAARNMKDFIVLTLGTGVGSGIVINGQMVYGNDGNAGELGHVIVEANGRLCGCGRKGCLETYTSATGLVRTVKQLLHETPMPSIFRGVHADAITSKGIYEAALAQDTVALASFDLTCKYLGQAIANMVAFSSPEAIILFGGLANAREFIYEGSMKYMEENLLEVYRNKVKIIPSELPESDAAILGAAALAWEKQ